MSEGMNEWGNEWMKDNESVERHVVGSQETFIEWVSEWMNEGMSEWMNYSSLRACLLLHDLKCYFSLSSSGNCAHA